MVFSRYVKILRGAKKTLYSNLLEVKVNPEISLLQTTKNSRYCTISAKNTGEISENSTEISAAPTVFTENVPTVTPKILEFTSKAPSTYDSNHSNTNSFGERNFTSNDPATEYDFDEPVTIPSALDICKEDMSHIAPYHQPSFNFAAYANDSPTVQELAKLGVKLYKVEAMNKGMEILLRQDFEEMKPYIRFLHDCGVTASEIGTFITKNPYIFTQDMDDLHTRIRYLRAHRFDQKMVARIVSKNPYWLMFGTKRIDQRLGFFQQEFGLAGHEVRKVATREPRVITYKMKLIKENTFAIREEMGFNKLETKALILTRPALLMQKRKMLVNVFDYLHNTMGLPHDLLAKKPMILTCRMERLKQRHKYLEALGKNQYDPVKPLYVSPDSIVGGSDVDFCRDIAKTSVQTYNTYLKSL